MSQIQIPPSPQSHRSLDIISRAKQFIARAKHGTLNLKVDNIIKYTSNNDNDNVPNTIKVS